MTPCTFCGGPYHPATGCHYGPRTVACGPCVRRFWEWFRQHQRPRKGKPSFYDAAVKWRNWRTVVVDSLSRKP